MYKLHHTIEVFIRDAEVQLKPNIHYIFVTNNCNTVYTEINVC